MISAMLGVTTSTRVTAGNHTPSRFDHGALPGGTIDTAGKILSTLVANNATRASPMTNSGTDASTRCTKVEISSSTPSRRVAANDPIVSESGMEITAATNTRKAEF